MNGSKHASDPFQIIRTGTNAAAVGDTEENDFFPGDSETPFVPFFLRKSWDFSQDFIQLFPL